MEHGSLNPWLSMWTRPRATIRQIVDTNPHHRVLLLAAVLGFAEFLDTASEESMGDDMGVAAIFLVAAIGGTIGGIVGLYFSGWLLGITGRWLGGVADGVSLRAAIAWGGVIFLWGSLLWIPELMRFGSEMFTTEMPTLDADPGAANFLFGVAGLRIVIGIWSFIAYLKCIGEVQEFSAWRALGSSLLTGVLIAAIVLVVVLPLTLLGLF